MAFTVTKINTADKNISIVDTVGDGSSWAVSYNARDVTATFIELDFIYTKSAVGGVSTFFTITNAHTSYPLKTTDLFGELIVANDGVTEPFVYKFPDEGKYFVFLPVGFTAGVVTLTVEPDVFTGTDTLQIGIQEQMKQPRR